MIEGTSESQDHIGQFLEIVDSACGVRVLTFPGRAQCAHTARQMHIHHINLPLFTFTCLMMPSQEMLFSMYSPADEEGPTGPTHGSSTNITEQQGLLAAGNVFPPSLSSR